MKTSEIKIFVDEELPMQEAIKRLSDEFILQGGYCDQTVIDLRDLSLYLLGRSSAMERLYRYTLAPPTSLEQVDELIRLKEWFDGAILTTPTRGKMMKEYKERIRHACGHVTVRINSAMDTHSHGHAMYNGDGMVSAVNMSPPCGVFVQEALVFH